MLATMDRQHDYGVDSHSKVDCVGEATKNGSPGLAVNSRKRQWRLGNPLDEPFQGFNELFAQARTARLVPVSNLESLAFGLGPEDDLHQHPQLRSFERTTAQGMPLPGFSRCSAQRRSSSARSASLSSS